MWQTTVLLLVCYMLTNYSQIYFQICNLNYYTFPAIVFKLAFEKIFLLCFFFFFYIYGNAAVILFPLISFSVNLVRNFHQLTNNVRLHHSVQLTCSA